MFSLTQVVPFFDETGRVATFPAAAAPLPRLRRRAVPLQDCESSSNGGVVGGGQVSGVTSLSRLTREARALEALEPHERTIRCTDGGPAIDLLIAPSAVSTFTLRLSFCFPNHFFLFSFLCSCSLLRETSLASINLVFFFFFLSLHVD